jgi:hypothetical protein
MLCTVESAELFACPFRDEKPCLGDRCMCWRYSEVVEAKTELRLGYCGIAGRKGSWRASKQTLARVTPVPRARGDSESRKNSGQTTSQGMEI